MRKLTHEELQSVANPSAEIVDIMSHLPFGNDANGPIHPMFTSLSNLTPDIKSALRLATHFLLSRHTLPFFHSLITSPLTLLLAESQYYNIPLHNLSSSQYQSLSDDDLRLTQQTFLSLSDHITLQISPDPRLSTRWAYTERLLPPSHSNEPAYTHIPQLFPTPSYLHNPTQLSPPSLLLHLNFRGTNALINISPSFLRILHPHTFPQPTQEQRLRGAFMLAVTLVHELAHAVYMCRVPDAPLVPAPQNLDSFNPHLPAGARQGYPTPPPDPFPPSLSGRTPRRRSTPRPRPLTRKAYEESEPFYADQRICELGHAWETTIFGGGKVLSLAQDDRFRIGIGWQRWPGVEDFFVRNWRGEVVPLTRRGGEGEAWRKAPKWETVYIVGDSWVSQWFRQEFWDRIEREGLGNKMAMNFGRVEKVRGVRMRNYDWVDEGSGDGWASDCSSRRRGADEGGIVRHGQVWLDSEDEDEDDDSVEEDLVCE